jgi:hypothetical protein
MVALLVLTMATSCSSGSSGGGANADDTGAAPALHGKVHVRVTHPDRCSIFATRTCLAPFPDDQFTVADTSTETGRRVNINMHSTPVNKDGQSVDTTEWNRNDGFSPGQPIVVFLKDVDPKASRLAPVTDIGRSLAKDAPIVVVDAKTGERRPYWAELDAGARLKGERHPALFIRPAENWLEGHRYLVALRGMKDKKGKALPDNAVFAAFRDGVRTDDNAVEAHRAHTDDVLAALAKRGVARADLDLAWDFTVASTNSLTERMLHIRDDAAAQLGKDGAPKFTVTATSPDDHSDRDAKIVEGTFEVPSYLDHDTAPGGRFVYGTDGLPEQQGTYTAKFTCVLPYVSLTDGSSSPYPPGGVTGAQAVVYGHGLLGSRGEVLGFGGYAIDHHSVVCATDWVGLAEEDTAQAVKVLQDLSNLPSLVDRSQQGFLDFQFLARLMKSPKGLVSNPAFQLDGKPLIATGDVSYWGRSQGGIYGGAATAISTEWTRALLGEPGINYSTLLGRSVDFDDYSVIQQGSYTDKTDWPILLSLLQMVWDRGEPDGYVAHMTDGSLPGTPKHTVMLFEAFGDHQVTNVATEVEARVIGAKLKLPSLADGRSRDRKPFWGIEPFGDLPKDGNVLYVWDFGTPAPPTEPLPNRKGDDPHDMDSDTPTALDVAAAFLAKDGMVVDACDGKPCDAPPEPH